MKRRQRKFVGVFLTLIIVVVWALGAMMLSLVISFNKGAPTPLQWVYYAVAGMGWVLPIMPLIRWMQKPDPGMEPEPWIDEA